MYANRKYNPNRYTTANQPATRKPAKVGIVGVVAAIFWLIALTVLGLLATGYTITAIFGIW